MQCSEDGTVVWRKQDSALVSYKTCFLLRAIEENVVFNRVDVNESAETSSPTSSGWWILFLSRLSPAVNICLTIFEQAFYSQKKSSLSSTLFIKRGHNLFLYWSCFSLPFFPFLIKFANIQREIQMLNGSKAVQQFKRITLNFSKSFFSEYMTKFFSEPLNNAKFPIALNYNCYFLGVGNLFLNMT